MAFNHRFLLRLITNLLICTLVLSSVGVLLWTVDEFIGWDILPENVGIYVRALIIGIAWVTFSLIVAHLLLSVTLFAEASASRAKLPDFQISSPLKRRLKRILPLTVLVCILLIMGLQAVDGVRKNITEQTAKQEAEQKTRKEFEKARIQFNQIQESVDQSLPKVLKLFTPSLLKSIQTNTISASEINQLFESVTVSLPHAPSLALLIPAKQPYKYYKIDRQAIALGKNGVPYLQPQFYLGFPTQLETKVVDQLFSKQVYALKTGLNGVFIKNTNPSSWGVLKLNNQAIALVYLGVNYSCPQPTKLIKDTCISPTPKTLHSN
jgi:hypothetical protein